MNLSRYPTGHPLTLKQNQPLAWLSYLVPAQSKAGVIAIDPLSVSSSFPILPLSKSLRIVILGPSFLGCREQTFFAGLSEYCGSIPNYYIAVHFYSLATKLLPIQKKSSILLSYPLSFWGFQYLVFRPSYNVSCFIWEGTIIKIMSVTEVTEEIQVTGSILSINLFEEKLMRNFFIINSRLKKLDQIRELDIKIKALQKEQKFMSNKMDSMLEKLPKDGAINRNDVKMICKDQVYQVLNTKDDRLKTSKFNEDLLKEIHSLKVDIAKIRVGDSAELFSEKKQGNPGLQSKTSFTAGQVLMQQEGKKFSKESLNGVLNQSEMNVMNHMLKGEEGASIIEDINEKFEDLYRRVEQIRLGKLFNEHGEKDIERYQKYQHFEQKSQNTTRRIKEKPMRLDGIKKQNIKGELLKNDLYAEYQKAEALRSQAEQTNTRRPSLLKGANTISNFKDDNNTNIKINDDNEIREKFQRLKPSKSMRKLQRIQRRLKVDDIKELNSVLKEIELRIQGKVTHQIFMGFVEDIEEKIQILRISKDSSNELSEMRKLLYSVENRLQSVITYLQGLANEDDALLVRKQWTCISCDKNLDRYNAKTGQHLNWDTLASKKISPTKAGAFGQTGLLANKIRSLMENGKGASQ